EHVELGEARSGAAMLDRAVVHLDEPALELLVLRRELARAEELRVVAPVAGRADPDLEQRRLVLLHRPVAGGGERPDPRPRPDERVAEREVDLAFPAGALAVHERLPDRGGLALLHAGPKLAANVLHRGCADVVGEPHAP